MKYLLDTCVISELPNRRPDPQVIGWLRGQDPETLYLSFVTIGEIAKGLVKLGDTSRRAALEKWFKNDILAAFEKRILPVERSVSLAWGKLCGEAERIGRKRPAVDALLAATALVHGMTIVTRNVSDMAGMGVPVFNPFSE